MKSKILTLLLAVLFGATLLAQNSKAEPADSLTLVSKLGHGFGQVFEVTGTLKLAEVGGKARLTLLLFKPQAAENSESNVIETHFFSTDESKKVSLEKGSEIEVKVVGYETIVASGLPNGLADYPELLVQGTAWNVRSEFIILKIVKILSPAKTPN